MKKVLLKTYRYAPLVATLAVFLFSCANPVTNNSSTATLATKSSAKALVGGVDVYTLFAGQSIEAGTVSIWRDSSKLYVKYDVTSAFAIAETHVWVGTDLATLPTSNKPDEQGAPVPGQFDYKASYSPTVSTVTLSIDFKASWEGKSLYIFTHAKLLYADNVSKEETGWAGDNSLDISRWNFYIHAVPPTYVTTTTSTTVAANPTLYSISGFVFHDLNNNGVKDDGEEGIADVALSLGNGVNATSDSSGAYTFANLVAGGYTVTSAGKSNFWPTPYDAPVSAKTVTLPESATGVNFGLSYESISGFAFKDTNADGIMNNGEAGIEGVALTLGGAATASATSGPNGSYFFDYLKGGSALYSVSAANLDGEFHTPYLSPVSSWSGTASTSGVNFGYSHEKIAGVAFYDANRNDVYNAGEPLLSGFTVRLSDGKVASTVDGAYAFDNLKGATTYTVSADDRAGFVHSVAASRTVTPANSVTAVANFGFAVDYSWIVGKTANGFTIGYWKTNLDKAIAGKTAGTQVSKANLLAYVSQLSTFALAPLNVTTLQAASNILSATGSAPTLLLAKQLMGSEFNYASGAFIGNNALATQFFLYDGEYMLDNSASFSSAQLLAQKDKYDAYNNSHGGAVLF